MPRLVKSKPRFKCDFCRYQATESTVIRHERICWNNPDRFCGLCQNEGWVDDEQCYYCEQRHIWDEKDLERQSFDEALHGIKRILRELT